jgi:hypothetical protein
MLLKKYSRGPPGNRCNYSLLAAFVCAGRRAEPAQSTYCNQAASASETLAAAATPIDSSIAGQDYVRCFLLRLLCHTPAGQKVAIILPSWSMNASTASRSPTMPPPTPQNGVSLVERLNARIVMTTPAPSAPCADTAAGMAMTS